MAGDLTGPHRSPTNGPGGQDLPYMVVVAATGQERAARDAVRNLGLACYMPQYRERMVRHGRKVWEERLLLGRYFFTRWVQDAPWRAIPSLRQVTDLFMCVDAEVPQLIRDDEVDRIRSAEDKSGFVGGVVKDQFTKGQAARVSRGVMQGLRARYDGEGRQGCQFALVELFGAETRVEFAPGVLQAA